MNRIVLLLGGNLGDKYAILNEAESYLQERVGSIILKSGNYETEAWGFESEDIFLNRVLIIETNFSANDCLRICQEIEIELGRVRKKVRYSSRLIDIDILFYNDIIIDEDYLEVPHPRIQERAFVLAPLTEIMPDYVHPQLKKKISTLMEECTDNCIVVKKS